MEPVSPNLDQLLHRSDLWRARDGHRERAEAVLASGYPELDAALHLGGWPAHGLTELLCETPCPQGLRLLLPALAGLRDGLVVLAGPPARLHTRTLRRAGLNPERLLVLYGRDPWMLMRACHECAGSAAASALVAWLPRSLQEPRQLRRLHRAARRGRCWLVLMRDARDANQPSPAPLRLVVGSRPPGDLAIGIKKQPAGWAGQQLQLAVLPEHLRCPPEAPAATVSAPGPEPRPERPSLLPPGPNRAPGKELPG